VPDALASGALFVCLVSILLAHRFRCCWLGVVSLSEFDWIGQICFWLVSDWVFFGNNICSFLGLLGLGVVFVFDGEFDPGSGRTLAACLTHASRTMIGTSVL
jgi:hypothetical protein